jgi:membrane-bound lytic murein transglycosylase D
MKTPEKPVTVETKTKPDYAAPVEKTKARQAVIADSQPELNIKLPELPEPDTTAKPSKPVPAEKVARDLQPEEVENPGKTVKTHVVAKGDTLFNISRRYGLTVAELQALNKLEGNDIQLGMELIVSK